MKIRKRSSQPDAATNRQVFRVDDEIEVVLLDADELNTHKERKSIQAVWERNSDWLGIKPLVLAGLNDNGTVVNARKRKSFSALRTAVQIKREEIASGICVARPIRSVLKQRNGDSHIMNSALDMTDLKPKMKMIPPNQVIVLDTDTEEFRTDVLDDDPPSTNEKGDIPALECDTFSTTVMEKDDRGLSPSSVVELVVEKEEIPTIVLEDTEADENVQISPTCNGDSLDTEAQTSMPKVEGEKKFQPLKLKKRFGELERLFVSLKEIPWAQHWSPNTFLSRNSKVTFPKRVNDTRARNKLALPPVATKSQNLQREKVKRLLIADNIRLKPKGTALAKASAEPPKKRRKLDTTKSTNGVAEPSKKNRSPVLKSGDKGSATAAVKGGPTQKLSTDLAIKKYDASKQSKLKGVLKKKLGVTSCSVAPQQSATTLRLHPKMPADKSSPMPYASACPQSAVPAIFRKELVKTNSVVDQAKPQVKVSPKILPFTSITKCNGISAAKTEGGTGSGAENRLGSEQLLQKQLVSVMGKESSDVKKRKAEEENLRYSVRQSECAFRYKEIAVKKHLNYIQIILVPNRTRHNGLTLEALHELREALISAKKDQSCKVLLLNSCGSIFCSGIDLASLVGQAHVTEKISNAVRSLIETLALFSKPVVAAVNGAAVGLGVTLLTYCDVVFASEKATFFTPYARLGHIPEGAMTLVLPQVVGSLVASDMLLRDRKLTAFQASIYGLVSEVIWPSQFMESVIPRVEAMASQSAQAMESTKILLRYHQWDKLQSTLEHESRLLPIQWQSEQCQEAMRAILAQPGGLVDW